MPEAELFTEDAKCNNAEIAITMVERMLFCFLRSGDESAVAIPISANVLRPHAAMLNWHNHERVQLFLSCFFIPQLQMNAMPLFPSSRSSRCSI